MRMAPSNPPDEGGPSSSPRLEAAPAIAGPSTPPADSIPDRESKIYEALTRAGNARNSRSLYAARTPAHSPGRDLPDS